MFKHFSYRWDDDVVFKNCAKDDDKPKVLFHLVFLSIKLSFYP